MLKTFRVFSRAVNKRGYTVGITQNVKAVNMQAAIDSVISNSGKAGLSHVIIAAVHELKGVPLLSCQACYDACGV
ncbi:hypothetical protein [Escherichia coli]|uniref:hypothetical protein n=2 Tax=Escherichia coli TaxID=562 RepID=UPI00192DB637|nr:hypothetical protein [Escherichia coli]MBL6372934.1 hypothetical protein [Escherichia coli]